MKAYYICADFEQGFYDEVIKKIVKDSKLFVPVKSIPNGVEVTTRSSSENKYVFIQNFNMHSVKMEIDTRNSQIILGNYKKSTIEGFDTIVLKLKR